MFFYLFRFSNVPSPKHQHTFDSYQVQLTNTTEHSKFTDQNNHTPRLYGSLLLASSSTISSRGRLLLQRRQIKRLAPPSVTHRPGYSAGPRTPPQSAHPRLHIPPHVQRHVAPLRHAARDISDLVLGALVAKTQMAGGFRCLGGCGFGVAFLVGGAVGGG